MFTVCIYCEALNTMNQLETIILGPNCLFTYPLLNEVFIVCEVYCEQKFKKRFTASTMSSMSDRKAELERKKAKLQALREEKDRRRREKEQKDAEEALVR